MKYITEQHNIVDGFEDDDVVYRRNEKGEILKETVHCFRTEPHLRIDIVELGADPLGRYQESFRLCVDCGFMNKKWNDYHFVGTLVQAKEICKNKLKEFAEKELQQLQEFLSANKICSAS